jgi:hypothetical protein
MSAWGGVELNTTYARSSAGGSMRRFHNDGGCVVDERQARAAGRRRRPWAPVVSNPVFFGLPRHPLTFAEDSQQRSYSQHDEHYNENIVCYGVIKMQCIVGQWPCTKGCNFFHIVFVHERKSADF